MQHNHSLLGSLGLELTLECLDALLELGNGALELLVVGLELVGVAFLGRAEGALDEVDGVLRLFGLLVETDEDLGELVDDAGLLEELAELLLLLFGCLHAH